MKFSTYQDKVRACWLGKNIGGTLGGPFEGKRGVFDLTYYTHDISTGVLPNDDLDLQLIWLLAAEDHGRAVNAEVLGEYWLTYVPCDWSEYGAGKNNLRFGLLPPVSGAYRNPYSESNGCFIRSEIWACLMPGNPAEAVRYAFEDGIVDHTGEGVYGELFCTALQSAAFTVSDIPELIRIGLSYIPDDCQVAKCIRLVIDCYEQGMDWKDARKKLLQFSPSPFGLRYVYDNDLPDKTPEKDIPMGQVGYDAPANVAISVIGLLYGENDFTKSLCIAANCGEDTDCTAGFIGALMGILRGCDGIEKRWIDPIGDEIKTATIDMSKGRVTRTVSDLTERVTRLMPVFLPGQCAFIAGQEPELQLPDPATFCADLKPGLFEYIDRRTFLQTAPLFVRREGTVLDAVVSFDDIAVKDGTRKDLTVTVRTKHEQQQWVRLKWYLPEGWQVSTGSEGFLCADQYTGKTQISRQSLSLIPPETVPTGRTDILLELSVQGRPSKLYLPLVFLKE